MKAIAHVDGACDNGGTKRGGYGCSLRLESGRLVEEYGHLECPTTSNIAEYAALLAALRLAHELGVTDLTIRSDSQLVVRQMQGSYKVKHPNMRPLYQQALDACVPIGSVTFEWIRREENQRADDLSKMGMETRRPSIRCGG